MLAKKETWRLAHVTHETEDVITIYFDTPGTFVYSPGQFVNLTLEVKGEKVTRAYSLSSYYDEDPHPAITVKRIDGGLMSNYIHANVERVQEWEIEGPFGNFTPADKDYGSSQVVLLAGGSGITPMIPIIRHLLWSDVNVLLVYSSNNPDDIIFQKALKHLSRHPRFKVVYVLSTGRLNDSGIIEGRLSKLALRKLIKGLGRDQSDIQYFLCGPTKLVSLYQETLTSLNAKPENTFIEFFSPAGTPTRYVSDRRYEVLLHFNEQTNLIGVNPGESVLDAALEEKVMLPYSCRSGTCGRCYGKVLAGKTLMFNNYALTEPEVADGFVLLCQLFPASEDVEIDVVR